MIYKSLDFDKRKPQFYQHCIKWSRKLPFVSKEMDYDLVSCQFEYGLSELFRHQFDSPDDIYNLTNDDLTKLFKRAKRVRDSGKSNPAVSCEKAFQTLKIEIPRYFETLFSQFPSISEVELPFCDDVRLLILSYVV